MKEMGFSKGYKHAHSETDAVTDMQCLPDSLVGTQFYAPTERGYEQRLQERLVWLNKKRNKTEQSTE
jgi:putative ATPase